MMHYLDRSNQTNVRSKLWQCLAPYYLNYADCIQFSAPLVGFDWHGSVRSTGRWTPHRLVAIQRGCEGDSLALLQVLFPLEEGMYRPGELVNVSPLSHPKVAQLGAPGILPSRASGVASNGTLAAVLGESELSLWSAEGDFLAERGVFRSNEGVRARLGEWLKLNNEQLLWANDTDSLFLLDAGQLVSTRVAKGEFSFSALACNARFNAPATACAGSSEGRLLLLDLRTNGSPGGSTLGHARPVASLDFAAENEHVLLSSDSEELVFWDLRNMAKRLFTLPRPGTGRCAFFPDDATMKVICLRGCGVEIVKLGDHDPLLPNDLSRSVSFIFGGHDTDDINFKITMAGGQPLVASADMALGFMQFWQVC